MNTVDVIGNIGSAPEVKTLDNGMKVTSFNLASNQRQKKEDVTTWWKITLWGNDYDGIIPHLKKGSLIMVVGEMQPPKIYTSKGENRINLQIDAKMIKFIPIGKKEEAKEVVVADDELPF
jgi:single-strand DNA-binding protein